MQNIPFDFILTVSEWSAAGLGLLGVLLGFRQHRATWIAWLVSSLLYLWLTFQWALYGQMAVMLGFVGVSLWGFLQWDQPQDRGTVPVSARARALGLLGAMVMALALAPVLSAFGSAFAILDAVIASFSLLAMVWTARRHEDCWPLWLVVNLLSVGLYAAQSLWPTVGLYLAQAVLAWLGLRQWRAMGAAQERALGE